eukprot:COSAG01_NODE_10_length_42970_cov_93.010007_37_plen_279_part_00
MQQPLLCPPQKRPHPSAPSAPPTPWEAVEPHLRGLCAATLCRMLELAWRDETGRDFRQILVEGATQPDRTQPADTLCAPPRPSQQQQQQQQRWGQQRSTSAAARWLPQVLHMDARRVQGTESGKMSREYGRCSVVGLYHRGPPQQQHRLLPASSGIFSSFASITTVGDGLGRPASPSSFAASGGGGSGGSYSSVGCRQSMLLLGAAGQTQLKREVQDQPVAPWHSSRHSVHDRYGTTALADAEDAAAAATAAAATAAAWQLCSAVRGRRAQRQRIHTG